MLTKEECLSALDYLCACACELADLKLEDWQSHNQYEVSMLDRLINEHFDNPPLKFEELKTGMWLWDNFEKEYIQIFYFEKYGWRYESKLNICKNGFRFEENRYYRKQVEE